MLYLPWRDETRELIEVDHKAKYLHYLDTIEENKSRYVHQNINEHFVHDAQELMKVGGDFH